MGIGAMTSPTVETLRIKIFADGADRDGIVEMRKRPYIKGFTTNPTLMRKAGVSSYESFAREVLEAVGGLPVSFEVFSDDIAEMRRQARIIAAWGRNVYVKIPITNTRRESSAALVRELSSEGVQLNVTALLTLAQVEEMRRALDTGTAAIVSLFAGRIADTGRDPVPMVKQALAILKPLTHVELLWASPRELLNIVQADEVGCHIITVTNDILAKLPMLGKSLDDLSLDTVKMFHGDAEKAGYKL
jgi:transaldolase